MKASKYLFLGMAALAFTACSNEEVINDGPVAAQVSAGIEGVQTRAAGTSWDSNDEIGISCNGGKHNTPMCIIPSATHPTAVLQAPPPSISKTWKKLLSLPTIHIRQKEVR